MEASRPRVAWFAVAAAVAGFLIEAVVASVPGSPLQPVLAPGAEPGGPFVWVAGYCDDVFAYLPSRRVLLEGGYEGRDGIIHQLVATPFDRNVEDRVMECVARLVAETNSTTLRFAATHAL